MSSSAAEQEAAAGATRSKDRPRRWPGTWRPVCCRSRLRCNCTAWLSAPAGSVDDTLTEERRAGMRRQRLEAAEVNQRLAQVVGALPAACGRCGESLGGGIKVVEVNWADLGAPYAPFTGTEFRLLAGVCRTCGAFVASRNYLPPELAGTAARLGFPWTES